MPDIPVALKKNFTGNDPRLENAVNIMLLTNFAEETAAR
jgi:hypothetical protein